ncbi:hypothetical protein [Haloglomus litoreum]|uniref:hypothetical protein n=1 Tax=Haloglomus litoreum TaxID=3034026 RepID=UPI0023E832AC|nr:hypothetical protein [Haloglomus sp. DT116]
MRLSALLLVLSLLLAGCGGFVGDAPTDSPAPAAEDAPTDSPAPAAEDVRYGIAVENEYASNRTFTVQARTPSGSVLLNRSRQLVAGERWHVANVSAADYGEAEYELAVLVDGDPSYEGSFSFRESERVTRRTGATLVVLGESTGETHTCAGNVTCYRQHVEE